MYNAFSRFIYKKSDNMVTNDKNLPEKIKQKLVEYRKKIQNEKKRLIIISIKDKHFFFSVIVKKLFLFETIFLW